MKVRLEVTFGMNLPASSFVNDPVLMLISRNLHNKNCEVSIITRSPSASLSLKGQLKHTTVKWSISSQLSLVVISFFFSRDFIFERFCFALCTGVCINSTPEIALGGME